MLDRGFLVAFMFILVGLVGASVLILQLAVKPAAEEVIDYYHMVRPLPTPVPATPVPTATPHPTPGPGDREFRVGVSTATTLTAGDLSGRRYGVNERRLQMPHCPGQVPSDRDDPHPNEYFWILLEPNSARLRTLVLDGVGQLAAWTDSSAGAGDITLDVGNGGTPDSRNYHAYRTIEEIRCGDTTRPGFGGAFVTITLEGE